MFNIVKLQLEHLQELAKEPDNDHLRAWFESTHARAMADAEETVAGFVNDELMVVAGLTPYWKGRAYLWCTFSIKAKMNFVPVFRGIFRYMQESPYRRIEMDVPLDLKHTAVAMRRAEMLGFVMECHRAKYYRPGGGDSALYSWTKET